MPNKPQEEPRPWYRKSLDLMDKLKDPNRNVVPGVFNKTDPTALNVLADFHSETVADGDTSRALYLQPNQAFPEITLTDDATGNELTLSSPSVTVEYSVSPVADIVAGKGRWADLDGADPRKATALRCTASGTDVVWEVRL